MELKASRTGAAIWEPVVARLEGVLAGFAHTLTEAWRR